MFRRCASGAAPAKSLVRFPASTPVSHQHSSVYKLLARFHGASATSLPRPSPLEPSHRKGRPSNRDHNDGSWPAGSHEPNQAGQGATRFEELAQEGLVSRALVDTVTGRMGLETMTPVQQRTMGAALRGTDMVAQARTGTGKTLAFLIPILQNIITADPNLASRTARFKRTASLSSIRAIVISPTRELAEQIAEEARTVVSNTAIIVQTAVGGSQRNYHLRKMRKEGCHLLVGTPGRLNDILADPSSDIGLSRLRALVLDEADRLLDDGFMPQIQDIQALFPNREEADRQTLMFSATMPQEVMRLANKFLKPDYQFIQTIQPGEKPTHDRVTQRLVNVTGMENILPALYELCEQAMKNESKPFKAMVFCGTNAETSLNAAIMQQLKSRGAISPAHHASNPLLPSEILEMHGKLSQSQRTRTAEQFRRARKAVMFTSDVTARGMDFPNVTHVIQLGLPKDRDTYIHRLGRTARAEKGGEGWLFLSDIERREGATMLKDLPVQADSSLKAARAELMQGGAQLTAPIADIHQAILDASKLVEYSLKSRAYGALIGSYQGSRNKQAVVDTLNNLSILIWGLKTPPSLSHGLAVKLGISRLNGLSLHGGGGVEDPGSSGSRSATRSLLERRSNPSRARVNQSHLPHQYAKRSSRERPGLLVPGRSYS